MNVQSISFQETNRFSKLFLDYISENKNLKPFYKHFPHIENFEKAIENKFDFKHRKVLTSSLKSQYKTITNKDVVLENIDLLNETNTFSITTGHQLNIATGPLFFIYKIISAINTCRSLKNQYPQYDFVPIYWMASEDHDYDEIKSFSLFGEKHTWETEQTGAVGRFNLDNIENLLNNLKEKIPTLEHYKSSTNLTEATRKIVHELFGEYGLICLDGDDKELKSLFTPYATKEIEEQISYSEVTKTNVLLSEKGYKSQAFPREINLFHLTDNNRQRIIKDNSSLSTVANNKLSIEELQNKPEELSPNVILRPLYQEIILPNLAYIGGPGELAYWFQLKSTFEAFDVQFPILTPRNHVLNIPNYIEKKLNKANVKSTSLFKDIKEIKQNFLQQIDNTHFDVNIEKEELTKTLNNLKVRVTDHNKGLSQMIDIELSKMIKQLENIEKKTKKQIEKNHEQGLKNIENTISKIFPNNSLQEREDNIFSFLLNDPAFISKLINILDPFDYSYKIITNE